MTEAEWLECGDPITMLNGLPSERHRRKLRLFACACCRRLWHLLAEESRHAIEVTERYADGDATADDLWGAYHEADEAAERSGHVNGPVYRLTFPDDQFDELEVASHAAELAHGNSDHPSPEEIAEWAVQAQIVRDVFGNRFRAVTIAPAWQTSTVLALAGATNDNRIFPGTTLEVANLAILADALEDAGYDNADILAHCRGPGPHVRGCWVVDLILGKS